MSQLTVIIPVFNQSFHTQRCLESLLAHSLSVDEVIIVDNHSTDETAEVLKDFQPRFSNKNIRFEILTNEKNVGFGRACNQGIRAAQGKFTAILNNDTWLMPGWDEILLKKLVELNTDMIGPSVDEKPFDPVGTPTHAKRFTQRNQGKTSRSWNSILMLFPKATWEKVGLFDERFFVTYEDTDLKERMDRAQLKYHTIGDCMIWHSSKGTRESGALPKGYEAEGLKLFIEKWGFDPRPRDHTWRARFKKRLKKIKTKLGLF